MTVGLDKNTNSNSKLFYNTRASWEQDSNLSGSLMICPIFGDSKGIVTRINKDKARTEMILFPHPNKGSFTLLGNVQNVCLFYITGKFVNILIQKILGGVQINMDDPQSGMYILRLLSNGDMIIRHMVVE